MFDGEVSKLDTINIIGDTAAGSACLMGTWIVGAIVFCIIGFAVYKVYKDRKNGNGCGHGCENCGYGCEGCLMSGSCNNEKKDE